MPENILSLHHVSMIVSDTARSLAFYCGILDFVMTDERPDLDFPGAWLSAGQLDVHLLEVPNPDPVGGRPTHGGRDRHVALSVKNIETLKQKLTAAGIDYTVSQSGRPAIFCRDPDGNGVELIQV